MSTITVSLFEDNEARGDSGNRGGGASFQIVGTGAGGEIANTARNTTGETVSNATIHNSRAVGGRGDDALGAG